MRLIILLLFIGLNSYAQRISIEAPTLLLNASVDTINNQMLLYYDDYYKTVDLNSFKQNTSKLTIDPHIYMDGLSPLNNYQINIGSQNYFVNYGGGMVYQFKNDTIKRIDKSFDHKMQHAAAIFEHDSKIFKYGGYGFWSVRDFFTYFDTHTKEWEVYRPVNSDQIPVGSYANLHLKTDESIYLFGGLKMDPHDRWNRRLINDEVWSFNFKGNTWHYLGVHPKIESKVYVKYKNKLLFIGPKHLIMIDIINNRISYFEHNPSIAKSNTVKHIYYFNNRFHMVVYERDQIFLDILDEKAFFGKKISEEKFYKNSSYWWTRSITLALIPIFIFLLLWWILSKYKKRNKIKLLDNGLRYKNKFTEFDSESMAIIKALLAEKELPSNKILSLVEKEQYSAAHNERIKVQKINEINVKIKTLFGTSEEMIRSVKSANDRRIRLYSISKEFFESF